MRSASKPSPWPNTCRKPQGGSSASLPPVKPRAASSAATMPFCAARPTWSGFVIVPKFTRMPAAVLAAIASAWAVFAGIEPQQLGRRRRRAERAGGAGRMESFLVVTGMNRLGDLAFDLEAGQERLEKFPARHALALADGERGRKRRHGRVRQQPEDAVGARRELRIVPVERVAARAVQQRRRRRAGAECARDRTPWLRRGRPSRARRRAGCWPASCVEPGQHHAKPVDDAALRRWQPLRREMLEGCRADEVHDRTPSHVPAQSCDGAPRHRARTHSTPDISRNRSQVPRSTPEAGMAVR